MKENLYYLFISGLILGSGPCLSFCAPVLISYSAIHKEGLGRSAISYLVFSLFKLTGYCLLGLICSLGVKAINTPLGQKYLDPIYITAGIFIILIGVTSLFYRDGKPNPVCGWIHRGNVRNVGLLGLLIGVTPCLPLLGILNYVILISGSLPSAIGLCLVFGLGTVISPLFIMVVLSGRISAAFTGNRRLKTLLRLLCAGVIIYLGGRIILEKLLR